MHVKTVRSTDFHTNSASDHFLRGKYSRNFRVNGASLFKCGGDTDLNLFTDLLKTSDEFARATYVVICILYYSCGVVNVHRI